MKEEKYTRVLLFLQQYGGNQYKKLEKCSSEEERSYMVNGNNAGQKARASFTGLVNDLADKYQLVYDRVTQWQNSGVFVRYFWCQLKKESFKNSPISLSLFAENTNNELRFRASVELATDKATAQDLRAYKKLLDIPLEPDFVYVSGGNNESEFRIIESKDNTTVKNLGLKKVQVSYIVPFDELSDDNDLEVRIEKATEKLLAYYSHVLSPESINDKSEWWPLEEEYTPGLSKEQWYGLLNDSELFIPSALMVMAAFFAEGGQATCAQLATKYGKNASTYIMTSVHLAERIMKKTGCPKPPESSNSKFWPILFVGKNATSDQQGAYVWKLRAELFDALEEFDILRFLPNDQERIGVFDSWEIVDEYTAIKTCDESFFEHNGSGVPKGICWFFGADSLSQGEKRQIRIRYLGTEYDGLVRNESSDRLRTRLFWHADIGKKLNEFRDQSAVRAKFVRTAPDEYELTMETEGAEEEMTVHEAIDGIKKYIAAKGFTYADGLIENFYLSLKSKPFVILAGTSGTGKTKLVKLFAEAIGATAENGRYKLVPVRPDWSDSSDLFGHTDLNNRFHPGAILDFLKEAEADRDKSYFLCLDEMNLARVEYYLSDILSVIETREKTEDGHIVSVPLIFEEQYGGDADAAEKYGTIRFPENLCLIGTVNMDETTFPFSKKVLDRANTIEFSDVDLIPDFESFEVAAETVDPGKLFLKPEYLQISHCKAQREYIHTVCEDLQALNTILAKANAHVGYRVRDEICFYMLNNRNSGLLPEDTAMDNEIMQKILPRIQGSSNQIREMLCALFKFCAGDYTGYDNNSDSDAMKTYLQNKGGKYRQSAEKIMCMVRRFDEDGFTSYWI